MDKVPEFDRVAVDVSTNRALDCPAPVKTTSPDGAYIPPNEAAIEPELAMVMGLVVPDAAASHRAISS